MYRRYFIIGFVFFLLIGAYFVFFDKESENNDYDIYYKKLADREYYSDEIEGVDISIFENEDNGTYIYSIIIDNVKEKESDIKVLILDENVTKGDVKYFPSFGIVDNKGCSLIPTGLDGGAKEKDMLSLSMEYNAKIEYILIYFNGNNEEQFAKIKVSDYLK